MILGHNIQTDCGYVTAADRAEVTGADVYQIFYRLPQSYKSYIRPEKETLELAHRNKKYNKKMVVHGSYLINLCQDPLDHRHYQGINILVEDLDVSVKLNSIGVIIHMGNDTGNLLGHEKCKENYILGIKSALHRSHPRSVLILETGAGCGSEVSSAIKDLGEIRKELSEAEKHRVKFCLDTCHMFAHGYRLDIPDAVMILEMDIDIYLGWSNVVIVHLNDSGDICGSRKDNHADIGKGHIKFEGLMRFVHICVKRNIPLVLETPSHYYNDNRFIVQQQMKLIRDYYNIMYENLGPEVEVITRTKKKTELRDMIKRKTKVNIKNTKENC